MTGTNPCPNAARNHLLTGHLLRTAEGDQSAFAAFYDETSPLAFGLALRILRNAQDAEDLTIEAYLQIWRSASSFNPARGTPIAWLVTIVRSRAVDRLRTRRTTESLQETPQSKLVQPPTSHSCPDAAFQQLEAGGMVKRALASLPPAIRSVLVLAYFAGLSHSEIAQNLGAPLGTVKTRIRRGLEMMRLTMP